MVRVFNLRKGTEIGSLVHHSGKKMAEIGIMSARVLIVYHCALITWIVAGSSGPDLIVSGPSAADCSVKLYSFTHKVYCQ